MVADGNTEATFRTMLRVVDLIRRVMQPYFAMFGISGSQWGVLRALHRAEQEGLQGLRLRDLGKRLLIQPPSVTGVVDRLHRMGLVTRVASTTDLRSKHIGLTPSGRQLVQRVLAGHGEKIQSLLGGLSHNEQLDLRKLLDRMGAHLEQLAEQTEESIPGASNGASNPKEEG